MKKFLKEKWAIPVATLVLTLSIGSAAFAATGSSSTDTSTVDTSTAITSTAAASTDTTAAAPTDSTAAAATDSTAGDKSSTNGETALTGDILAQVKAAALAAAGSGATLQSATNETDNSDSSIKYEAFVTKSDGTSVKMYLDASFKVVSSETGKDGKGGRGGHGSHGSEAALTGTTLEQVKAAAVAKLGSDATIVRVETDAEASETGHGPYEVHATLADGTNVVVYVDSSFNYVSTETMTATGHDKDSTSNSTSASDSTSTSTSSN
jgi:trimeric autotransporter adhesin